MFSKLNKKFPNPNYKIKDRHTGYLTNVRGQYRGTNYYHIDLHDEEIYLGIIPKKYWNDFMITLLTVDVFLQPHTDSNVTASINFYIDTHECHTVFYVAKDDSVTGYKTSDTSTNGQSFNVDNLSIIGSFIAEPGDCYVFDPNCIHGVYPKTWVYPIHQLTTQRKRKAISMVTDRFTYDEVVEMCKETGFL